MLSSYLLQVPPHSSLQIQNSSGAWIAAPPKEGTLVVALGQGLEAITAGVVRSTTHRVVTPAAGEGPRYSIPFFQGVSYDAAFESMADLIPPAVRALKPKPATATDVEFTFSPQRFERLGEATLMNRVKSHPDVAERWYPDLLAQHRKSLETGMTRLSVEPEPSPRAPTPETLELPTESKKPTGRRRAPTIVVEKTEGPPSYGEDPGPDGSLQRKEAYQMRRADAEPDEVRVVKDPVIADPIIITEPVVTAPP